MFCLRFPAWLNLVQLLVCLSVLFSIVSSTLSVLTTFMNSCKGPRTTQYLTIFMAMSGLVFDSKIFLIRVPCQFRQTTQCSIDVVMWNHAQTWSHQAILCNVVVNIPVHHADLGLTPLQRIFSFEITHLAGPFEFSNKSWRICEPLLGTTQFKKSVSVPGWMRDYFLSLSETHKFFLFCCTNERQLEVGTDFLSNSLANLVGRLIDVVVWIF